MYELLSALQGAAAHPAWWMIVLAAFVPVMVIWLVIQGVAGASTYVERKVAADIQRRVGPNQCNVGSFFGAWAKEVIRNGKGAMADAGGRFMAMLFIPLQPIFAMVDKVTAKFAPGILIFLADGIKLIMKEDITPKAADKPLFKVAPVIVLASAFGALATLPYSDRFYIADFNVGLLYIAAIASLETIGILMAGWASNNKWALLGGFRSAAQVVSYELPAGLAILTAILLCGTMSLQDMTVAQLGLGAGWQAGWIWHWNIFSNPFMLILAPVFFLAALAECNRTPFDIPEAESELVAGYHTEYTGMRFAFFFMAEYAMMFVVSGVFAVIFLGGWSTGIGALETWDKWAVNGDPAQGFYWYASLVHLLVFCGKAYLGVLLMMWIRWTIPRFRVDQMMSLCWRKLIPISMTCFTAVGIWVALRPFVVRWAGSEAQWQSCAGYGALAIAVAIGVFLVWFILRPLTPDEQLRRKLIKETSIKAGAGHGFA
ncbi:MAG: NADH-quinone oxidoreductase subunit H [Planctomycetes bacterium]|nr:NADH-quinone oxidoreductase subunit H [Planctomycetota bacterium]